MDNSPINEKNIINTLYDWGYTIKNVAIAGMSKDPSKIEIVSITAKSHTSKKLWVLEDITGKDFYNTDHLTLTGPNSDSSHLHKLATDLEQEYKFKVTTVLVYSKVSFTQLKKVLVDAKECFNLAHDIWYK